MYVGYDKSENVRVTEEVEQSMDYNEFTIAVYSYSIKASYIT